MVRTSKADQNAKNYADRVNKALKHAQTTINKDIKNYAQFLDPMLRTLGNDYKTNRETEYYRINPSWDGDLSTLFKNIEFKKIPQGKNLRRYGNKILKNPHSTAERYKKFTDDWHNKSFRTNRKNTKVKHKTVQEVVEIMNTSFAWKVASKDDPDSKQALKNWQRLYKTVSKAYEGGPDILEDVETMIENNEDLDYIVEYVDNAIMEMLRYE